MTKYKLSESSSKPNFSTTFRYDIIVYVSDLGVERESNIGSYIESVTERPKFIKLTSLLSNESKDLVAVLNNEIGISKVVIQRRSEFDGVILTSTYKTGDLIKWITKLSAREGGRHGVDLSCKLSNDKFHKLEELDEALKDKGVTDDAVREAVNKLADENSINISLKGTVTDHDKDEGNKLTTIDIYLKVDSYKHKLGE